MQMKYDETILTAFLFLKYHFACFIKRVFLSVWLSV